LRLKRRGVTRTRKSELIRETVKRAETLNPINMQKGKTLTLFVLVVEIASIIILHAVKINQSEKMASKEIIRNSSVELLDSHQKGAYSLAAFK
jgi:hypothetical protein